MKVKYIKFKMNIFLIYLFCDQLHLQFTLKKEIKKETEEIGVLLLFEEPKTVVIS